MEAGDKFNGSLRELDPRPSHVLLELPHVQLLVHYQYTIMIVVLRAQSQAGVRQLCNLKRTCKINPLLVATENLGVRIRLCRTISFSAKAWPWLYSRLPEMGCHG